MIRVLYGFARMTKRDVRESTYEELVQKMARIYGYQQFRSRSTLSLLEVHHLYSIFNEKDRVLDIGTGQGGWAQLATKFTKSTNKDPLVICVDKNNVPKIDAVHAIHGDILQKETRVEIVQKLGRNLLNTILIDVDLNQQLRTGFADQDAPFLNNIIMKAIQFGRAFVKPGGTVVCKSLMCQQTLQMQKYFKMYFTNVSRHCPAYIRKQSPMRYFILKGFLMTDTYIAHSRFQQQLKNTTNKQAVLNKFKRMKNKGQFDPQKALETQTQLMVYEMLDQNMKQQTILKQLRDYAFLDLNRFIEKYKKLNRISQQSLKEKEEFIQKQLKHNTGNDIVEPEGIQDNIDIIEQYIEYQKQVRDLQQIPEEEDELLAKDQQYLKFTQERQEFGSFYQEYELTEEAFDPEELSKNQLKKLDKLLPGFNELFKKFESHSLTNEDIVKFSENPEIQQKVKEISKGFTPRSERLNPQQIREQEERIKQQEEKLNNFFQEQKTTFKGPQKHRRPRDRRRRPQGQQNPDRSRRKSPFDLDF